MFTYSGNLGKFQTNLHKYNHYDNSLHLYQVSSNVLVELNIFQFNHQFR